MKTNPILLYFILFTIFLHAQEKYKMAEGYYNMSSFEVAAGMHLLENKSFYFATSFGNVDLELYGIYEISEDNILSLKVEEDLKKEFYLYGLKNENLKDKMSFQYQRPYEENAEKLFLIVDGKRHAFPIFSQEENLSILTIKKPKSLLIIIGYEFLAWQKSIEKEKRVEINLKDSFNEIKILHNYYDEMTDAISKAKFNIENGTLKSLDTFDGDRDSIKKSEISDEIRNEIMNYIRAQKNKNQIVRGEKIYEKL